MDSNVHFFNVHFLAASSDGECEAAISPNILPREPISDHHVLAGEMARLGSERVLLSRCGVMCSSA